MQLFLVKQRKTGDRRRREMHNRFSSATVTRDKPFPVFYAETGLVQPVNLEQSYTSNSDLASSVAAFAELPVIKINSWT